MDDAELKAMGTVLAALESLEGDAQRRVLAWVRGRLDLGGAALDEGDPARGGRAEFADVAELVHAANPRSGREHALVVGYWLQVLEGKDGFGGSELNGILKNLGHGLSNVSVTLKGLMTRKPAYVMQTAKGQGRSARKTYKLTTAGITRVKELLRGSDGEE